jgi:hypothetical protein
MRDQARWLKAAAVLRYRSEAARCIASRRCALRSFFQKTRFQSRKCRRHSSEAVS